MKRYRDHTNSTPLKDDASRIELLPIESEAGSYNSPPTNNRQDSAEGQSHKTTRLIKGWPQSFKTLKKTGWKEAASLAVDTFIALIPLLFTGKSQTAHGTRTGVQQEQSSLADKYSIEHRGDTLVGLADISWRRQSQGCYNFGMPEPVNEPAS